MADLDFSIAGLSLRSGSQGLFLGGSRALLYSHVTVEMLRKQLIHQLGEELARSILAQAGRQAGFNDAQLVLQERSFDRMEEMLEMQYALLGASGFGRFNVLELVIDKPAREFYARARCEASLEAESHRRLFGLATEPSCCHLVGYSTGWFSAVSGMAVLTIESRCVAKGDDFCELETLPYADFAGPVAAFWKRAFESTSTSLAEELREKLETVQRQMETISRQERAIEELSTPVLQISDQVLVLPVIGTVFSERAALMAERLLEEVVRCRATGVIIDITGVPTLDTGTADHLVRLVHAVRLLGARAVLTGISPRISQVLVSLGVELTNIPCRRTLQDGIRYFDERD